MIPHTAPPVWPEGTLRPGRFAGAIFSNTADLLEDRDAADALSKCLIALVGLPDDTGVELNHGRVGAKGGPHAFRAALARYGAAIPMDEGSDQPGYPRVFDAGDIIIGRDIRETHDRVTEVTLTLLEQGLFPIAIGGGHDLTFPFVRAVSRVHGTMSGLYLDAHLDVRPEVGSGMAFRSLVEGGFVNRLSVIGLDRLVNSREHYEWFTSHGGSVGEGLTILRAKSEDPAFVSLDLDVLDSAYAPGVSAKNPCGLSPWEVGDMIEAAGASAGVRCFDIMELNPVYDVDGRTARVAAHMFLRFLRGFARRGG